MELKDLWLIAHNHDTERVWNQMVRWLDTVPTSYTEEELADLKNIAMLHVKRVKQINKLTLN